MLNQLAPYPSKPVPPQAGEPGAAAPAGPQATMPAGPPAASPTLDWTLLLPAAAALVMMLWGVGGPSYWRDEADTVSAVSRSFPELVRMLGHVDAVHGLYYLLLWPLARVAGTGETVTRLPSALAMAAAAWGVAAIGRRLVSRRAALCSGLVFAALPEVSVQGHSARPYAMVTAGAVLASYLLLQVVAEPRPARLARYGSSIVLLGYLHLFALLLVAAHAVTLAALGSRPRRRLCVRWLTTVTGAGAVVSPLAAIGWRQRGQVAWIQPPGWHDAGLLATSLAGGTAAAVVGLLATAGAVRGTKPALGETGASRRLAWLAVPWLVLPPAALFAVSAVKPVYYLPYVVFCLPAVALLTGSGLAALGWPARAASAVLLAVLMAPTQCAVRTPGSGGALLPADQVLAARGRPADAIVYPRGGIPPWARAYPDGFGKPRDIGLGRTGPAAGRLYGTSVRLPVLLHRECGVRRVWAAEMGPHWRDPAPFLALGFRLRHEWRVDGGAIRLWLYQNAGPGACAPTWGA